MVFMNPCAVYEVIVVKYVVIGTADVNVGSDTVFYVILKYSVLLKYYVNSL